MTQMTQAYVNQLCGWMDLPDQKVYPHTFQEAAPNLQNYWQGEEIGLWVAAQKVNGGKHLPADKQTIGDCVSHGHARGVDYLYCTKQAAGLVQGYIEGQTSAMSEYIYGSSREYGGGLGPSDGSVGAWAVGGLKRDGYVMRKGKTYDGQTAKQYGWRGVPKEMKSEGVKHILTDYAQLSVPQDMANALKAGSPCPICSDQGFSMERDKDGICKAQGTWNHCMLVVGMYQVSSQWYFVIVQSWGQNTPSGPTPAGGNAPDNSFGCHWDTMGRILSQKDSSALSGMQGWEPITQLDWIM